MAEEWVEPRMPSRPRTALPSGACDTHAHVFDPSPRYPFAAAPSYPPPDARADRHIAMLDTIGATHGILVQPAAYGTDASLIADACRRSAGRLRGVAAADSRATDSHLAALVESGIRGLRFTEIPDPRGGRSHGAVGFDEFERLAPRMREHGLHAVLWAPCEVFAAELPRLVTLGVPIALDHIGSVVPARGLSDPFLRLLKSLLAESRIWVKLVACRVSSNPPDYADLRPIHTELIAANPDNLLWGSDWPYVRLGEKSPDVGALIDLFLDWVGCASIARKILVDNPARLYGFDRIALSPERDRSTRQAVS